MDFSDIVPQSFKSQKEGWDWVWGLLQELGAKKGLKQAFF